MARNPSIGNVSPYAVDAIAQGISATEGLRQLRDSGLGVNTQKWYRAYGEAQAAYANRSEVLSIPSDQTPRGEQWVSWNAGKRPAYAYQVDVHVVDPGTGLTQKMPRTIVVDTPITIGEAQQAALDQFDQELGDPRYPLQAIGSLVTGLYQMTGTG